MGSNNAPDVTISIPPNCDIREVEWGKGRESSVLGIQLFDSHQKIILCKTWNEARPESLYWENYKLLKDEKLVGFYGHLNLKDKNIKSIGLITAKVITKREQKGMAKFLLY